MFFHVIVTVAALLAAFVDASAIKNVPSGQADSASHWTGVHNQALLEVGVDIPHRHPQSGLEGRGIEIPPDEFDRFQLFAQFAGASYCEKTYPAGSPVFCNGDICPAGQGKAKIYALFYGTITDIFGFVSIYHPSDDSPVTDPTIVVSVRGSQSLQNFLTDAVFASLNCEHDLPKAKGCTAHAGFLFAFREIVDAALDAVRSALADLTPKKSDSDDPEAPAPPRIVVTGHSLGGAVATLLGAYLRDKLAVGAEASGERVSKVDIYSYGAPRVGNDKLAEHIGSQPGREFRVTHYRDVVPRLPPMMFGFRHTTPEYFLATGPNNRMVYRPDEIQDCHGITNDACNAGFWFPDIMSHMYYLVPIASCGRHKIPTELLAGLIDVDDSNSTEIADPEIRDRFKMYAKLDMAFSDGLEDQDKEKPPVRF